MELFQVELLLVFIWFCNYRPKWYLDSIVGALDN